MANDAPTLTVRDLNRATLARQGLLEPLHGPIPRTVEAVGALQSQHPEWPLVALGSRLAGLSAAKLARAFAERRIVRASLMRITLHVVSAGDYRPMHAVVAPFRLDQWRLMYRRDPTGSKLRRELARAHASVRTALADHPLRRDEIAALLAAEVPRALRALPHHGLWRHFAATHALVQVPQAGERYGGGRYALADEWLSEPDGAADLDDARRHMLRRYFGAFGPATLDDALAWIGRGRGGVGPWRAALAELADELVELRDSDGRGLLDLADAPRPGGDVPAPPRLLARWDSVLLAHATKGGGRVRVLPQRHHATVNRKNGDVLPTFLVDGFVAGTWEPSLREPDGTATVTLRPFGRLTRQARADLEREAIATLELVHPQAASREVHVAAGR